MHFGLRRFETDLGLILNKKVANPIIYTPSYCFLNLGSLDLLSPRAKFATDYDIVHRPGPCS